MAGQWRYVFRAIDPLGQIIDVFVSPHRDAMAARQFFQQRSEAPGSCLWRSSPTGAAAVASPRTAPAPTKEAAVPGWLWVLIILIVLGLVVYAMRGRLRR